jgi:hypothetical protein
MQALPRLARATRATQDLLTTRWRATKPGQLARFEGAMTTHTTPIRGFRNV